MPRFFYGNLRSAGGGGKRPPAGPRCGGTFARSGRAVMVMPSSRLPREPRRTSSAAKARLAIDIGGTFTDVVAEHQARRWTAKLLTTPEAPERGFLAGVDSVMKAAGLAPADLSIIIHGTTLATNAL